MLKQYLQFKLSQKLSPQQIQLMKLIQLPTQAFEQRLKQELEENPALERGKDNESDDFEGDINWKRLRIIEDCEVNGVRFPAGIQIDVKLIDAERLLEAGQAEMVEKPVNPVEAETEEAETEDEAETEEAETEEETADETSKTLEEDTDDTEAEVVEGEDDAEPTEEEDDTSDSDAATSGDEESD